MKIRKEIKNRIKELIATGVNASAALTQARKEANIKYGKGWRDAERMKKIEKFLSNGGKLNMSYHK